MAITDARIKNRVCRQMENLGRYFGESTLFVAQHYESDHTEAAVLMNLVGHRSDGDTEFLTIRRMFRALEYRFNKNQDKYTLKVSVERREK